MTFSKNLEKLDNKEVGLLFTKKLGSSALKKGIILAILSLSGKMPFSRDRLIISANGADIR